MSALYRNDRANGDDADTPSNMKKRHRSSLLAAHSRPPPSAEIEHKVRAQRGRVGANRGTSNGVLIVEQMQAMVSAMREGNQVFREIYAPQISGEDTFNLIRESGCDEDKVSKIYCFLMHDVSRLRAVIQCPPPMRKQVIMQMVFGG